MGLYFWVWQAAKDKTHSEAMKTKREAKSIWKPVAACPWAPGYSKSGTLLQMFKSQWLFDGGFSLLFVAAKSHYMKSKVY